MNKLNTFICKSYNNRSISRTDILANIDSITQLFDLSKPILMDDLSYLINSKNNERPKNHNEFFKKEFICNLSCKNNKLMFSFVYKGITCANELVCFKSNKIK